MRIRNFLLAIAMFAAGCVFTSALSSSRPLYLSAKSPEPVVGAQTAQQRWEYRAVTVHGYPINADKINTELSRLGEQGFEEIVWSDQDGTGDRFGQFHLTILLRRPKK
jgi:hypothetical protein